MMQRFHGFFIAGLCFQFAIGSVFAQKTPVVSEDQFLLDQLWDRYQTLPNKKPFPIGVVLGGGGARGLAHIGVLKAFEQERIPISMIAGTSVGAIVGALYAGGVTTTEMEKISSELQWSSFTNYSKFSLFRMFVVGSPLTTDRLADFLKKRLGDIRFEDLRIPFSCVATDLQTGERIVFREGDVIPAVRASATVPGLFQAVPYRHRFLVDGGLVSNIPTDLVSAQGAQLIVAIDVTADFSKFRPSNMLATLNQALYIQGEAIAKQELARADIVIRPSLGDMGPFEIKKQPEAIHAGIFATRLELPRIKQRLIDLHWDQIRKVP